MLSAVVMAAVLSAAAPPKVASLDWSTVNVTPELAAFYGDALAQALRKEGLQVVTSRDIATLLGMERQRQLLGCAEEGNACVAELGAALGCDLVLTANLARLGTSFRGTVKLLSAVDGTVKSETLFEASSEEALADELPRVAQRLAAPVLPRVPPPSLRSRAWMPAAAGGALLAGAAVGFTWAWMGYTSLTQTPSLTRSEADINRGQAAQVTAWVLTGLGVAALGTAAAFYVLGDDAPTVTPSVSVTPAGAMLGLAWRWP